jgi:hypothetical protein
MGSLGRVAGDGERGLVLRSRLVASAQPPEQVGADSVEQVIRAQIEAVD